MRVGIEMGLCSARLMELTRQRPTVFHLSSDAPSQSMCQDPIGHHYRLDIYRIRIGRGVIYDCSDFEELGGSFCAS
jgi:hypothetical protein